MSFVMVTKTTCRLDYQRNDMSFPSRCGLLNKGKDVNKTCRLW